MFLVVNWHLERLKKTLPQPLFQEFEKERWKNLNEIIEETKKEIKEKRGETEMIKVNEREGILEAKYKKLNQPEIYSLEKILSGEEKI